MVDAGLGDDRRGDGHLPRPGAERGQRGGDPGLAEVGRAATRSRGAGRPGSGGSRPGRRARSPNAASPSRAWASRAAATGSRSGQARGGGGPVPGRVSGGRAFSGQALGAADGVEPDLGVAARRAQLADLGHLLGRGGREVGQLDDDRVGQDPAGRGVPPFGDPVAGEPQLLDQWRCRAACGPGASRRYGATGRPGPAGPRSRAGRRTPRAAHSRLALGRQVGGDRVAQLDEDLDVEGGVAQPGLGQRSGRPVDGGVLLGQRQPEVVLHRGAEARPGAGRRVGPRARCRTAAPAAGRPARGTAGPESRRGGPTPRPRCRRRPGRGRGSATGSMSQVPEPARRSCTR